MAIYGGGGCLWKGRGFKPFAQNGNVWEIEIWPYFGLKS